MINQGKVFIIAEAGINHNGDIRLAKDLIDVANDAGADPVKFETFVSENVISRYAPKAKYQLETTQSDESQLDMAKKLELSYDQFLELYEYSNLVGIKFLSTPFDEKSLEYLIEMGMDIIKIPSGETTNLPYL